MASLDFSARPFKNLQGVVNTTTDWLFAPSNKLFSTADPDGLGWSKGYLQTHTRVLAELPHAVSGGSAVISGYWTTAPYMRTKFGTSKAFVTVSDFIPETLRVYLGGVLYDPLKVTTYRNDPIQLGKNKFILSLATGADDNYMWVSYVPWNESLALGDNIGWFWSRGALAEVQGPAITPELMVQVRRAVNNIEAYLNMESTVWHGGPYSSSRGVPGNLIPGVSPVVAVHLSEVVAAVKRIEQYIDDITPTVAGRYSFSSFGGDDFAMIEYLEEIMVAIRSAESYIITQISGKDLD